MSDIRIDGTAAAGTRLPVPGAGRAKEGGFDDVLKGALGALSQVQKDTETAARELAGGGDVTSALIAMEKADMSFQLMVEVRNRLLNAYDEVMRMQI